ncbi:hypothetical protein BAUCODRAFT_494698 [Baudoinia panamericana UAMH 10762]|uniref:PHD-type domain-containing protein n=1 Tax=Baudoinia panamericana (strain UAMH 10762) TaxID=717646 RepID=M2LMM7_BAUPA|nr:uncharacterized protein BAUCODRAFT_494698 [Baudoinia panamericana UAMH 10762]EMC95572.1 hypothetical protein BAUCODRAFT_494698 [Baudoinia panamericana UAMH 10762]
MRAWIIVISKALPLLPCCGGRFNKIGWLRVLAFGAPFITLPTLFSLTRIVFCFIRTFRACTLAKRLCSKQHRPGGALLPSMPGRDSTETPRLRRNVPEAEQTRQGHQVKDVHMEKTKGKPAMGQWVEPPVATRPSYQDHNGAPYGVVEHMQPLGEVPSAKVKGRVRSEAPRKSVMGRSSAAVSADGQATPEGTPVPQTATTVPPDVPAVPAVVIDDVRDAEYAPMAKKKETSTATPPTQRRKRRKEITPANIRVGDKLPSGATRKYDAAKLKSVVDSAIARAVEANKPDLAAAVQRIWETNEFQEYVKQAKDQLRIEKNQKRKEEKQARKQPAAGGANGAQAAPLRSPPKLTSPKVTSTPATMQATDAPSTAIPSTEQPPEASKSKLSLKLKGPAKDSKDRRRSVTMDHSPTHGRTRPKSEESELTDLTSEPEPDHPAAEASKGRSSRSNGIPSKNHAAERGTLAAPDRKQLKRSSAEADINDEERERTIAAKKQKLNQSITRDVPYEESDVRQASKPQQSQTRATRANGGSLVPPSVSRPPNGSPARSLRGSRQPSAEPDSPLSDLSPPSSRLSTPPVLKVPPKPPGKRAKTKTSPEKKQSTGYGGLSGAGGAGRESPIGDDDNEEQSENNDFCAACGGSGYLLCCDGCDRSFHFTCLDPPLNEDASELNEPWYCFVCVARRPVTSDTNEKPQRGLFAPLLSVLKKRNPSNFSLPESIRNYYDAVQTGRNGDFVEAVHAKTRNRAGYDELPDYYKLKDGKGNTVICYSCGKTSMSQGQPPRQIISCDYCVNNWHLDCLDPPLANPPARSWDGKKLHDWMCPLHADHELRNVPTSLLAPRRRVHVRRPRNAKVVDTSLKRGFNNHGVVDVAEDETDDTDSEFYDEDAQEEGVVYRMPATGIKLDFIDKVKNNRIEELEEALRIEREYKRARLTDAPSALHQANFLRRSFAEKQTALTLAQFASANNDLELGNDQVENLVVALIAEAPTEVVDEYRAAEDAVAAKAKQSSAIPPSPPNSDQTDQLSAEQRKELLMLQELIRRKLESSKA